MKIQVQILFEINITNEFEVNNIWEYYYKDR